MKCIIIIKGVFCFNILLSKIAEVNEQSSGNFTCTASNTIGEDSIVYVVTAILPPAAPALSLQYTTASSIKLHWQLAATDVNEPILGKIL